MSTGNLWPPKKGRNLESSNILSAEDRLQQQQQEPIRHIISQVWELNWNSPRNILFPPKTNWHLFHFFGTIMSHLMGNLSKTRKYLVGLLETTFPFSSYFYYILSRKPSIQLLLFCIPFRNHKLYSCSEFQMEMLSKSPFVLLFQVGSRLPRLIKAPK